MGLLRLLLALSVAIHHIPSHSFVMLDAGVAVLVFFMISGFYMAFVINEKYAFAKSGNLNFYVSRLLRIFPPYWVVLVICILWYLAISAPTIFTSNLQLGYFRQLLLAISNISIIGQDICSAIYYSLSNGAENPLSNAGVALFGKDFFDPNYFVIGQAWSMATEILFYLAAPFIVVKARRILIVLAVSLFVRFFILTHSASYPPMVWGYRFFPSTFTFFCLGAIGYFVYTKIRNLKWSAHAGKAIGVVIPVWFIFLAFNGGAFYGGNSYDSIRHWIFFLVIAASIPFLFLGTMNNRVDRALGELSYPLYLVHGIVLGGVFQIGHLAYGRFSSEAIALSFAIIAAIVIYIFVDRPVDRFRKGLEMTGFTLSVGRFVRPAVIVTIPVLVGVAGLQTLKPDKTAPILVQIVGSYNIVNFDKKYFAIPQGIPADLKKDDVEHMAGVYVSDTSDHVIEKIPKISKVGPPILVKVIGNYNVVRYRNRYFGLPQNIAIDWESDKVAEIPGVLVDANQDALEAAISRAPPASSDEPRLLQSIGNYNIVQFRKDFFAVPHGLSVDWRKDNVQAIPGVILDSSLNSTIARVRDREAAADPVPHLRQTVGHFNIVQFHQIFYAIPQGQPVNWEKDQIAGLPGVKSADQQDALLKLIQ